MFNSITKKDIDLLVAYNRKSEPSRFAPIVKAAIVPLCLILIFGSVFAFQKFRIASMDSDIKEVNQEIKDYTKKIASASSDAYDLYNEMAEKNTKIEETINNINSYPKLTTTLMNTFINNLVNGLSFNAITYQEGVVSMSCSATDVLTIENYVRTLRASNLFIDVNYDGYQTTETSTSISSKEDGIEDVDVTTQVYTFSVNCVVKGVGQ